MSEFWQGFGAGIFVAFLLDWGWVFVMMIVHKVRKKGPLFGALCLFLASTASAQTITCLPMGQSTTCYNGQGWSTFITPMSPGMYSYGNSNGQMGTVYVPPTPQSPAMPGFSRPFPPVRR